MRSERKSLLYAAKIMLVCLFFGLLLAVLVLWLHFLQKTEKSLWVSEAPPLTYIVDPGHGGRDGGAVGGDGTTEKELNLEVAVALCDYLRLCGVQTVMTRSGDSLACDENDPLLKGKIKTTDLKKRMQTAQSFSPYLFLSIHMNKFPKEKYSGLQVYFSPNHLDSKMIADRIQERVRLILQPENDRRIKAAGSNIFLLYRLKEPAILIECGFLSNPDELERLKTASYRVQLAVVIADSVLIN